MSSQIRFKYTSDDELDALRILLKPVILDVKTYTGKDSAKRAYISLKKIIRRPRPPDKLRK